MKGLKVALLAATATMACAAVAQEPEAFTVDAAASDIHWRVYRAGTFSRLGHNHVVSVAELTGSVMLAAEPEASTFELAIPVASLVVDEPELRSQYGEEFSSVPSADDIAGTHRNMLSDKVLDGEHHSRIVIRGKIVSGSLEAATFALTIEMLGRTVEVSAPGTVEIDGNELTASGEFRLTHADLGMKPFTVMLGALAVDEPLDFSYRVEARRSQAAGAVPAEPEALGVAARPLPRPLR